MLENPLTLSYQHCSTLVTYIISIYGHKLYEYIIHHNMYLKLELITQYHIKNNMCTFITCLYNYG